MRNSKDERLNRIFAGVVSAFQEEGLDPGEMLVIVKRKLENGGNDD